MYAAGKNANRNYIYLFYMYKYYTAHYNSIEVIEWHRIWERAYLDVKFI